jgi:hypothetical protein
MRKTLVLLATLGTFAVLAAPAAAGDYRPRHPQVTSSFGLGIFVWPAPKTVHHYRPRPWHLRPQPVYRFAHPLPRPRWHHWQRPQLRHFDRGHHERRYGDRDWRHGDRGWRHGHSQWRDGDQQRRHGDQDWRHRSGRDHARHDRRRH